MKSVLVEISSMKFEKMLFEYWELSDITPLGTRLFRDFKEVWKWFYDSHSINKQQFNKLFLRLLVDNRKVIDLHGSVVGTCPERLALIIPDDSDLYRMSARKKYCLWSIDWRYVRVKNWCGKTRDLDID